MTARPAILRRWDRIAFSQLAENAARLAVENETLAAALYRESARADDAEAWAESWRNDFLALCEDRGDTPGITVSGALVAVPASEARP